MNARHIVVSARAGHGKHKADRCAACQDGNADHEMRILIDAAERGAHSIGVGAHCAVYHIFGNAQDLPGKRRVGGQQHTALAVAYKELRVRHVGGKVRKVLQLRARAAFNVG